MEKILFETLDISEEIKRAIRDMGFEEATPVQGQSIGPMMARRDMNREDLCLWYSAD